MSNASGWVIAHDGDTRRPACFEWGRVAARRCIGTRPLLLAGRPKHGIISGETSQAHVEAEDIVRLSSEWREVSYVRFTSGSSA